MCVMHGGLQGHGRSGRVRYRLPPTLNSQTVSCALLVLIRSADVLKAYRIAAVLTGLVRGFRLYANVARLNAEGVGASVACLPPIVQHMSYVLLGMPGDDSETMSALR